MMVFSQALQEKISNLDCRALFKRIPSANPQIWIRSSLVRRNKSAPKIQHIAVHQKNNWGNIWIYLRNITGIQPNNNQT